MLWTLVTVTYNSAEALRGFFRPPPPGVEWIVVDNCSSDASASLAADLGAKVIRLDRNAGFGVANDIGIREARGRFVGCVNPDVEVRYEDLALAATRAGGVSAGRIVAPQLVNADLTLQPNGRGVPTLLRKVVNRLDRDGQSDYRLFPDGTGMVYVAWVTGAAVLADREVWLSLGGWDPRFFVYYEDHDLGLRAWSRGVEVVVDGAMQWVHGWERATDQGFRLGPWLLELDGFVKFYSRYPGLLLNQRLLPAECRPIYGKVGRPVQSDATSRT